VWRPLTAMIENRWLDRHGSRLIGELRASPAAEPSPLLAGLQPYPGGWRASIAAPRTLPHYPLVLHRGGFPDGS